MEGAPGRERWRKPPRVVRGEKADVVLPASAGGVERAREKAIYIVCVVFSKRKRPFRHLSAFLSSTQCCSHSSLSSLSTLFTSRLV